LELKVCVLERHPERGSQVQKLDYDRNDVSRHRRLLTRLVKAAKQGEPVAAVRKNVSLGSLLDSRNFDGYDMTHVPAGAGEQTGQDTTNQFPLESWFRVSPAMLHSIDSQGRLISVSDAWLAKLGYEREEVLGKLSSDFLTPESQKHAVENVLPEFFRRGHCENVEYEMIRKDGHVISVLLSGILQNNSSPDDCRSIAIITDVTELRAAQRRSSESEALYRCLVEDQSELVSLANPEGELQFVNHAFARLCGLQPHEFHGRSIFEFIRSEDHAAAAGRLHQINSQDQIVRGESQFQLPDGNTRWISWTHRAVLDAQGKMTAIHSVGRDIEERIAADRRLKESETRYRLLADNSTDLVFRLDADLIRRYVSPACKEILGYDPEELIGVTPFSMVHSDDAESAVQVFQSLLDGGADRQSIICRVRHREGHWIWIEGNFRAIKDPSTGAISGITGALRDISVRKSVEHQLAEANRRLETLAREDSLTRLSNRRAFDLALTKEYRRAQRDKAPLALIMIDVDRFKSFNDRYGHPAGDDCLRRISDTIKTLIRRPGDMAARYGGEEFAVLLPGTGEQGAAIIAEKIRAAVLHLAIEHEASPQRVVTISAEVASAGPKGFDRKPGSLLDHADKALYHAKNSDRNTSVLASGLQSKKSSKAPAAA
jgi:diguanylate cyclase (GGDEF)-like protein/PAS domain S-box-containing protein